MLCAESTESMIRDLWKRKMADKAWKAAERSVARRFGSARTPLSGGNSKISRADVLHPRLFIEVKYRKRLSFFALWDKVRKAAAEEEKLPVLALKQAGRKGFLVVLHIDQLEKFIEILLEGKDDGIDGLRGALSS